jgi:4-diphosphocytidyl-2-C-methyl-D-erythritol kinase
MVLFPNCKINLGLYILDKRKDGFHNLETVFYPVGLRDALEIIPAHHSITDIEFTSSGLKVDGDMNDNICIKAYHLLKKDFPGLPAIKMHLHKTIPMGAGLGGGSADGAFALQLLSKKFSLNLSTPKLLNYALQLGSDGPFFIINTPSLATGRGEILEPINIDLSAYQIILINPGIHINTGWAFTHLTPAVPEKTIATIIAQPIATWKEELKNDFEKPVFEKYPEIKNIKAHLYDSGAVYAAMSGSGSTIFGIFEKDIALPQFSNTNYFVRAIKES